MEPAPEGPLVKPKRQMTEAQLEALKRGRAKLAEKRRQTKEAEATEAESNPKDEETTYGLDQESDSESESESEQDAQEEAESQAYCSVM